MRVERTPQQWEALLNQRKDRLRQFLTLDSPNVIVYHEMRLVMRAMVKVEGRRSWYKLRLVDRFKMWREARRAS